MPTTPTGIVRNNSELVIARTVPLSTEEAWAALTDSDRLAAWYGTWAGDPATGITVTMTSEEGNPQVEMQVVSCEAPRGYIVQALGEFAWRLGIEIAPAESGSTVTLVHYLAASDAEMFDSIGPGWEYYLDCFVAAETGGDPGALDFGDYFPTQQPYYQELSKQLIFLDPHAPGAGLLKALLEHRAEVLESIRAFESQRYALSLLDDADKTDKRTTVFVNPADLVWAWIAQRPGEENSLLALAERVSDLRGDELIDEVGKLVAGWEFTDPEFVAVVEADGGLAH